MAARRPFMATLRAFALALCAIALLLSAAPALYFAAMYAVAASYSGTLSGFFVPAALIGMLLYPFVAVGAGVFVLAKLRKRLCWGALAPPLVNVAVVLTLLSAA